MNQYEASTYGERIAEVFDQWYAGEDTEGAVEFLSGLAGGGDVLELGVGTGRVALPLAARGVKVQGIDASPAMIGKLRTKPGGEKIPVALGNFADVPVQGLFNLIYVVFNTFFRTADSGSSSEMLSSQCSTSQGWRDLCPGELRAGFDPVRPRSTDGHNIDEYG